MPSAQTQPQMLVGPRSVDDRICRLMYVHATDEVWTEEWDGRWVRTSALVRHVLNGPTPGAAQLRQSGIPEEQGLWDRES